MLISAAAKGANNALNTPVSPKSSGPSIANPVSGFSARALVGTLRAAHTRDVSVAVAVMEKIDEDSAQDGTSAPGPSRTTAMVSGKRWIVNSLAHRWQSWRNSNCG